MEKRNSGRKPPVFVILGGAVAAVAVLLALALAPSPERPPVDGSSASPAASDSPSPEPSDSSPSTQEPATGVFPNGTRGLGQPYLFGAEDAPRTLTIWEDTECPACAAFEYDAYAPLGDALAQNKIRVEYFIAPTAREGSVLAALALGCAADQNKFKELHTAFFANQRPAEDEGFTFSEIAELGEVVGISDSKEFETCIEEGRYVDYVQSIVDAGVEAGLQGTPTIILDGEEIAVAQMGWEKFLESLGLNPADYPYGDF